MHAYYSRWFRMNINCPNRLRSIDSRHTHSMPGTQSTRFHEWKHFISSVSSLFRGCAFASHARARAYWTKWSIIGNRHSIERDNFFLAMRRQLIGVESGWIAMNWNGAACAPNVDARMSFSLILPTRLAAAAVCRVRVRECGRLSWVNYIIILFRGVAIEHQLLLRLMNTLYAIKELFVALESPRCKKHTHKSMCDQPPPPCWCFFSRVFCVHVCAANVD